MDLNTKKNQKTKFKTILLFEMLNCTFSVDYHFCLGRDLSFCSRIIGGKELLKNMEGC